MKLFAEIDPVIAKTFLPISLAYSNNIQNVIRTYKVLLDISLSFILLPVLSWHQFKVLEYVNIWMLPYILYLVTQYARFVGFFCLLSALISTVSMIFGHFTC